MLTLPYKYDIYIHSIFSTTISQENALDEPSSHCPLTEVGSRKNKFSL